MVWIAFSVMAVALLAALALPLRRRALAGTADRAAMPRTRFAAAAFAGLAPVVAFGVYLKVGEPAFMAKRDAQPAFDFAAIAALPAEQQAAAIETMVTKLAARLKQRPDDAQGWRMLARSNSVLGRVEETAMAFDGLFKSTKGTASDWRAYMEVLVALGPQKQNGRDIAGAARTLNSLNPDDPLALYFLGDASAARGDFEQAVRHWRRLLSLTPADAPVRPEIERLVQESELRLSASRAAGPDGLR